MGKANITVIDKITDKCPNCGATLYFHEIATEALCPYCSSRIRIRYTKQDVPNEQYTSNDDTYIVSMQAQEKDAQKSFLEWLAKKEDIPQDVFDVMKIVQCEPILMPVYDFGFEMDLSYSASIGYDRTETYTDYETKLETYQEWDPYRKENMRRTRTVKVPVTKSRTVTDWSPFSDVKHGVCLWAPTLGTSSIERLEQRDQDVKYQSPDCEYDGKDCSFLFEHDLHSKRKMEKPFDGSEVTRCKLIANDLSSDKAFELRGVELLNRRKHEEVEYSLPGDRSKNIDYSSNNLRLIEEALVFLPFWLIQYSYKGKLYSAFVDGIDPAVIDGYYPANKAFDEKQDSLGSQVAAYEKRCKGTCFWVCFAPLIALTAYFCFREQHLSLILQCAIFLMLLFFGWVAALFALGIGNLLFINGMVERYSSKLRGGLESRAKFMAKKSPDIFRRKKNLYFENNPFE